MKLFVKKLLPSDMSPYAISSAKFVDLSNMQGFFLKSWYKDLNVQDKEIYFLSGLLQESGKRRLRGARVQIPPSPLKRYHMVSLFLS